jgi:predicted P-loop ATPase
MADPNNVTPLWKAGLQRGKNKDGEPCYLPTLANVALILSNDEDFKGCFARNEFSGETELIRKLPPVTGMLPPRLGVVDDYTLSYTQIALSVGSARLRVGDKLCAQGIESASRQQCYNPLQDSLRELPWDGTPRLDSWLSTYLGAAPSK